MIPFDEAWGFLKADESYTGQPKFGGNQKQPLDMVEYPEGSGNFMSLRDMLEARNAQSRANLAEMNENLKQGYIRKPNVAVTPEKYPMPSTARLSEKTRAMTGRFGEDYANRQQMKEQREADNAAYRLLRQKKFNETQGSPLTHGSGRYDSNNPDAMHPMGSGQ